MIIADRCEIVGKEIRPLDRAFRVVARDPIEAIGKVPAIGSAHPFCDATVVSIRTTEAGRALSGVWWKPWAWRLVTMWKVKVHYEELEWKPFYPPYVPLELQDALGDVLKRDMTESQAAVPKGVT